MSVGQEGVLVRWQYKTHHQQFLPRLGAPIYHVAISPDDSLTAISQKDNGMLKVCEYEHTTGAETAFLLHEVARTRISCKRGFGTFVGEGGGRARKAWITSVLFSAHPQACGGGGGGDLHHLQHLT